MGTTNSGVSPSVWIPVMDYGWLRPFLRPLLVLFVVSFLPIILCQNVTMPEGLGAILPQGKYFIPPVSIKPFKLSPFSVFTKLILLLRHPYV